MASAMNPTDRQVAYRALVEKRKRCTLCAGCLDNASSIDSGGLDCDQVGPYTQWQGNLDSPLIVVGQDFGDVATFRKYKGWPGWDVDTNENLVELAREAGFELAIPHRGHPDNVLFFTNAVLCLKRGERGGRSESVPNRCFRNCASFLKATIELVGPRVVVTLGARPLAAARYAFGISNLSTLSNVVGRHMPLTETTWLVPVYHPSPLGVAQRPMDTMRADWQAIRCLLETPPSAMPAVA